MKTALILSALAAGVLGGADFKSIDCPNKGSCSYRNDRAVDEVVSLFFQVELTSGESEGGFTCSNGNMVYCNRKWSSSDSGSAGDCFFVLPAGASFDCTVQGTVNFIGAHAAQMSASLVSKTATDVPCAGASCSYTNSKNSDMWVAQSFEASGSGTNSMSCSYNNVEVCAYSVGSLGGYSCNYFLPAGATVNCKVDQGSFRMLSSAGASTMRSYLPASAQTDTHFSCPNMTGTQPNLCDCSYTNPHADKDLVVTVASSSVDNNYNSFHCYFGGANVCAWGSNTNNQGNGGGCYFILPAGQQLQCQMEWGAAAFSVSTAVTTNGTLFSSNAKVAKRAAPIEEPVDMTMSLEKQQSVFTSWKRQHNKVYASKAEEEVKFQNFRKHLSIFHKRGNSLDKTLPNSLADWSKAEFETYLRDCSKGMEGVEMPTTPAEYVITEKDIKDAPVSVDWRTKGVVTPVKNQAQCGSCWSFSTTGVIEGAWAMAGNRLQSLSEQELVSCEKNCDGCDGGWPYLAIEYVKQNGDATEESYPYVSGQGNVPSCTAGHTMADVKVTGYYAVNNSEDAMAAALVKYGPVSITVDAMTQLWWPYTGGIMTGCCNHEPDHAVLLVGYGVDQGTKYWLIKNSWGTDWGEDGYLRLERGSNQCGITSAPTLAFVQGGAPMPQPTCPPETVVTNNTDGTRTCEWRNNTNGVIIPPPQSLNADCSYWPKENSFSYIWDGSVSPPANYPCPSSAQHQEQGAAENFCVFYNGAKGLHIPTTATVDCSNLVSHGRFSYTYKL
eukprot:TRINITY_DN8_c0_g1_i10.p1 TRINITY_DN8_c0_g1~~TRINITY_DN8_c0_g1_i10.p1  ORF type:complete len:778 (+),score=266.13 TRINITY_DN8_c0_g1_i10:57-2390(+)